jgi:polysaccharide deacetylase 2 family uncharacterized protein YibQ
MSKKRQTQQLTLSLVVIFILSVASTLFYLIDSAIDEHDIAISEFRVIDNNRTIAHGIDYDLDKVAKIVKESDKVSSGYLSEIKDLHDSLKSELEENQTEANHSLKNIALEKSPKPPTILDEQPKEDNKRVVATTKKVEGKLAIIIDDVAFSYQVKRLKSLGIAVTLSFFPADINHPQTSKYASREFIPMLHLPLEAQNFKSEEIDTLHVGDSATRIESRVAQLKRQFPDVRYTNNHTGSKFTSDYHSMKRLLTSLSNHNIQFIDSVTTSKSVVERVSNELGLRYIRRDIFIDNQLNINYILNQLQKAINIAKKRGYAVAIGHPHKATIKALSKLKPLLNGVELVYINEI